MSAAICFNLDQSKILSSGNGLSHLFTEHDSIMFNSFPNKPWFSRVCSKSVLKTLFEKEKLLVTSNFSFSNSVFYPFGKLFAIFIKFEIVVCKLFQYGSASNLSFGKGLNRSITSCPALSDLKLGLILWIEIKILGQI